MTTYYSPMIDAPISRRFMEALKDFHKAGYTYSLAPGLYKADGTLVK